MSDLNTIVDAYLEALNEADSARRTALIKQAWAPNGRFVDPLFDVEGHAALNEMAAGVQVQYPGHRFRRTSGIDSHHDQVRFTWEMVRPDGSVLIAGTDTGYLAEDGRLHRIAGFFGEIPQEAAA